MIWVLIQFHYDSNGFRTEEFVGAFYSKQAAIKAASEELFYYDYTLNRTMPLKDSNYDIREINIRW